MAFEFLVSLTFRAYTNKQTRHLGAAQNGQSKFSLQPKLVALTFRAETNKLGLGSCPKWLIKVLACPNL